MFAIRFIFWMIVVIVCFFIMRKHMRIHKFSRYLIVFIITGILLSLSALVPFENAFVTFSSPESAYRYIYMDKAKLVVEGEESALVIGKEKDTLIYSIIPESNTGWKLGIGLDINTSTSISNSSSNIVSIWVDQYKDTEDYYITVFDSDGAALDITDNRNSKFYHLDKSSVRDDETFYTYYAYVHDLDDKYSLIVNGEVIPVLDK